MVERTQSQWRHSVWPLLLLPLLTIAVFGRVVGFSFVYFDDPTYVSQNRHVLGGLSWTNVAWAWSTTHFSNWHPLTWLSYQLDATLFGNQAGGFHLTNLLLHTANGVLLFAVLRQMTGAAWKSAFVAALFAVHPLHVESVAWISERKGLLSTLFGLLALGAYGRYARRGGRTWYLLSLSCFACSLLAKQMLVTLPFLLLLLDYWPLRRLRLAGSHPPDAAGLDPPVTPTPGPRTCSRLVLEKVPFLALSVVFSVIIFVVQQNAGSVATLTRFSLAARCLNAVLAFAVYLRQTLWPSGLTFYYPHPGHDLSPANVIAAALLLAGITAVTIAQRRQRPYLVVGWLWYLGTLLPVIGIVQIGAQQRADRYTYIPLIGLFVGVTWLVSSAVPEGVSRRFAMPSVAALVLAALAGVAHQQTGYWQNSVVLFERALAVTERNIPAHINLGNALCALGRYDDAVAQFRQAVQLEPNNAQTHNNLGNALDELGRHDEALHHYREAIRIDSRNALAHNNLGAMLARLGRYDEAIGYFTSALEIESEKAAPQMDSARAHYNLGRALAMLRRYDEAVSHFKEALNVDPRLAAAHVELADALGAQRRHQEAIAHYRQALLLAPDNAQIHNKLGLMRFQRREYEKAIADFGAALEIDPKFVQAHYNIGSALHELGRPGQAKTQFRKVLAIDPDNVPANFHLARLYLDEGKRQPALAHLRAVIRVRPDFPRAQELLRRASAE